MKKTILLVIFSFAMLVSCSSSNDEDTVSYYQQIAGEWHLSTWNGETTAFEVYISFNVEGIFTIYQKVEKPTWEKLHGSYRFDKQTISGIYDDNMPWGSSYQAKLDVTNQQLTLISNIGDEVCIYVREEIPSDVKKTASVLMRTRSIGFRPL